MTDRKQKQRQLKNGLKTAAVLLLLFAMAISLCGCRESLVIAKIIHDQQQEEIDPQTQLARNDENNEEEDEDLPQKKTTEATKSNEPTHQADTRDQKQNNPGSAPKTVHDKNSSKNNEADKSGSNKGDDSKNKNKNASGGNGSSGGGGSEGGQGGTRQIYDDNGNVVDLPEEVNSVVAAGDAGVMVQMLGGKGILSGTSASTAFNSIAQSVFADEGFDKVQAYWDGKGNTQMKSADFNALLANKPDVCVGTSGSFSGSQIEKLQSKGISYVALPAMDTPEHIEKAVSILGKMIGDRSKNGGVNAKKLAADYVDYCDDLLNKVSKKVGNSADSTFGLYVGGWDDVASLSISSAGFQETGIAYTSTGIRPVAMYMQIGGVTDNTMVYKMTEAKDYAIVPLNVNVESGVSISNGLSMLQKTDNNSLVRNSMFNLGDSHFQWIITDSQYTRDAIENSRSTGGMWTSFPRTTVTGGGTSITDWGFVSGSRLVRTNIRGDYQITVNPYGAASWADGSPESVLESMWSAYRIAGAFSEADMRAEIKSFYSKFYRCSLSSSQINTILAGQP